MSTKTAKVDERKPGSREEARPLQEGMPGKVPDDRRRGAEAILREQAREAAVEKPAPLFIP